MDIACRLIWSNASKPPKGGSITCHKRYESLLKEEMLWDFGMQFGVFFQVMAICRVVVKVAIGSMLAI